MKKLSYLGSSKVIKKICNAINSLIDSVTTVEVNPITDTGTKIAELTVNDTQYDLYAPNGGGGSSTLAGLSDVDFSALADGQTLKYNATSQKWENVGGGGGGEIVDIFNGASTVSLASYNGITLISSSVTDSVGTASMSEWSNGYEGFNIALQNLVLGKTYTLNFKFQVTSGQWFSNLQYRFGYMITATNRSDYSNYTQWGENLDRDLLEHSHSVEFVATATTMYLSFNLCGFSDSVTNYYTISELCVTTASSAILASDVSFDDSQCQVISNADDVQEAIESADNALNIYGNAIADINLALGDKADDPTTFTEASTRANIASGDTFATILGKISKWFTDLPSMFVSKSGDTMKGNFTVDRQNGTTAAVGYTNFTIGNNIAEGTEKNSQGAIRIYSNTAYRAEIQADNLTNNRAFYLPNKSGTFALTSDLIANKTGNYKDFKSLASGDTVDIDTFTVPREGIYIVNFSIAHCGASNISNPAGKYWKVQIRRGNSAYRPDSGGRDEIVIPIGTEWDQIITATQMYYFYPTDTYYARFENRTGSPTDGTYNSRVTVTCYYLGLIS